MNLHNHCRRYRRGWLLALGVACLFLVVDAGCQRVGPQPLQPTPPPNLTPMRERDLSLIICQESDFPQRWTMEEVITAIPSQAVFPEEIVSYYGVFFEGPERADLAGCHIFIYGDEATAQRALETECSRRLPPIAPPQIGEETCAFQYEVGATMFTVAFRQREAMVVIVAGNLSESEVWPIAEAVDRRLR